MGVLSKKILLLLNLTHILAATNKKRLLELLVWNSKRFHRLQFIDLISETRALVQEGRFL
jgi:hypothetical protein